MHFTIHLIYQIVKRCDQVEWKRKKEDHNKGFQNLKVFKLKNLEVEGNPI